MLEQGQEEVRVVGFGDSITGVYYHTGGYRAWPELLEIALKKGAPKAQVRVFNAGRSGHTTDAGLKRIQRDVLSRKPHLVVVMFGMNDLAYGAASAAKVQARGRHYTGNVKSIVEQCRGVGAEVLLLTPNSVYPESAPRRPPERLAVYTALVREVAAELNVPVADSFAEWERIRKEDPTRWRLLMSETIHPNLNGHRVFAEMAASAVFGREILLADLKPYDDCLRNVKRRIGGKQPIRVVAAQPVAEALRSELAKHTGPVPSAIAEWPVAGKTLKQLVAQAKRLRGTKHELVVLTLSPEACALTNEETFIRDASWVVNYALPFGARAWDVLVVAPSVTAPLLSAEQRRGETLFKSIVAGHDLVWVGRPEGSTEAGDALVERWLAAELGR